MHFFQLIQQSAQHIYHSALPLSPKSSIFFSLSPPGQSRISDSYARPDRWGSILHTIPGRFTCVTTIGPGRTAKIAGACDDGRVRIYDSVTGVLKLSLRPEFPIQELTGPADGSLLVCTHSGQPFITLWDLQTGGHVHTFVLKEEAKYTTVSLKGRYLACETSENTVGVWETASRAQHPDPLEEFEGTTPCWLAPEELIMCVDWRSAYIQNVVTKGPPAHKFDMTMHGSRPVYSQIFDRLVIVPSSIFGNHFIIIDAKTGMSSTLNCSGNYPFSAFSQTTEHLVCGGGGLGLDTVDISTGCRTHFDFPAEATSVSTLSDGTVVANFQGSGIQLLSLDQEHASPRQPTPPLLTMYPLDEGRIIAVVPETDDRTILLETATMSQVFSIPLQGVTSTVGRNVVVCASLENRATVYYSKRNAYGGSLSMWKFSRQIPRWTTSVHQNPLAGVRRISRQFPRWATPVDRSRLVGSISPAGTRYAALILGDVDASVCIWDAHDGEFMTKIRLDRTHHSSASITFDSEDRFYLYHNTHRELCTINTASQADNRITHSITRCAKQQLDEQALEKRYRLDDGREWVIRGSQRICWVPPGYIGSSHCWAGSSLVMVGQDGTLRKLTFQDSSL